MSTTIRILLASFLLQSTAANGEILLSTLNNRQNSPPRHAAIGNYFGEDRAVSFSVQTGNNPDGYLLNSVTFNLGDASGSPDYFLVGVSQTFLNDTPAVLLGNSIPRRAGRYTYRLESRYFLKPNTEYLFSAVAFGNTWNNYFLLPVTTADERVRSSDGWRITYTVALASRASGNEAIAEGGVPLIAIDATKISPPKPTPPPLSSDASLRSLSLSGIPLNFASNTH